LSFTFTEHKPVLYLIGDSTVKNGDSTGKSGLGWGSVIDMYFDTTKIGIQNHAVGGRSSRTFITEGRWDKILATLKKGDYVIMQFGHNDGGALDDAARSRGTIKGSGDDSLETYNPVRKQKEMVYTYGHYMRKYVNEAHEKGATAIICSPVPRREWKEGKLIRDKETYAKWSKEVGEQTKAQFIDLHNMVSDEYDKMDTVKVNSFFPIDHTHTNKEGAILNAKLVVTGIRGLRKCNLKKYLSGQ